MDDPSCGTVLLTRQSRYPAYVNDHPEPLIEVAAGLLDERSPEDATRHEAEEEAGCRIAQPRRVFEAFMSPRSMSYRASSTFLRCCCGCNPRGCA